MVRVRVIAKMAILKWTLSLVVLVIILATEPLYRRALFDRNLSIIAHIQYGATKTQITFWKFWSDFWLSLLMLAPIFVLYILPRQRPRLFYYLCCLSFTFYTMSLTKMLYKGARPPWFDYEPPI